LLAVVLGVGGVASADPTTTAPRTLRTGSPACGNVLGKTDEPIRSDCGADGDLKVLRRQNEVIATVFRSLGYDDRGIEVRVVLEHERA